MDFSIVLLILPSYVEKLIFLSRDKVHFFVQNQYQEKISYLVFKLQQGVHRLAGHKLLG